MSDEEKRDRIDEILMSLEDWMHGEDGKKVSEARKLLNELILKDNE